MLLKRHVCEHLSHVVKPDLLVLSHALSGLESAHATTERERSLVVHAYVVLIFHMLLSSAGPHHWGSGSH